MLINKPRFPVKQMILVGWMPSLLKVWLYRLMGYRIGKRVSIGFGSVVIGSDVEIGEFSSIGMLSFVRGKRIQIGRRVSIGSGTMIDTPQFEIGDGSKINEQVFIGGLQFPNAELKIGRNCQIMQMTFINPAVSIEIGDNTGIGGDCLIFGHTSWLSKFDGYPVDFRPIKIGNSVSVAWRVFVGAGAVIGDGAVIGANSLVNRTIPSRCLATGSPAKVVSKAPYFPREVTTAQKDRYLKEMVDAFVNHLEDNEFACWHDEREQRFVIEAGSRGSNRELRYRLFTETDVAAVNDSADGSCEVLVSLPPITDGERTEFDRRGIMWIDLDASESGRWTSDLGEEFVQFLKIYGVRVTEITVSEATISTGPPSGSSIEQSTDLQSLSETSSPQNYEYEST